MSRRRSFDLAMHGYDDVQCDLPTLEVPRVSGLHETGQQWEPYTLLDPIPRDHDRGRHGPQPAGCREHRTADQQARHTRCQRTSIRPSATDPAPALSTTFGIDELCRSR